jgi:putative transposase
LGKATQIIENRNDEEVQEVKRLRELEAENARLKRLLAERLIEIDAMQELLAKKW